MHSWRTFGFHSHEFHLPPSGNVRSNKIASVLCGARALSTAGDFLFRVIAAVWALQQTGSAALTGLIIVLPGVAGVLCRGRLFKNQSLNPARLLIALELTRGLLFLGMSLAAEWYVIIVVMAVSGALQPAFDGAFAGFVRERVDPSNIRRMNGMVRIAMLSGTMAGLVIIPFIHISIELAAIVNGVSFLISAGACVATANAPIFDQQSHQSDDVRPASVTWQRRQLAAGFLGASFGLALSAPSIIQICIAALPMVSSYPSVAYALYESAVVAGTFLGISLIVRRPGQLTKMQVVSLALAINAAMLIGVVQWPVLFLTAVFLSALAEAIIIVDLQSRFQTELSTLECEEEVMRFSGIIAIVAGLGFAANLVLQQILNPIPLLAVVSCIGLCSTAFGLLWKEARSTPEPQSQ